MKTIIFIGMSIGSYAGAYVPAIWGGSVFSVTSIFLGAIGGFAGIWVGYKVAQQIGLE